MELGSEFHISLEKLSLVKNHLFEYLKKYKYEMFVSGRQAISCIPLKGKGYILLPEYICESVLQCFQNYEMVFYKIKKDFSIDEEDLKEKIKENMAALYVIHYFGKAHSEETLLTLKSIAEKNNAIFIEDTTQSLFSVRKLYGDYGISSIRKWMPIPMGGLLYSSFHPLPDSSGYVRDTDNQRVEAMILKDLFLKGRLDCNLLYREIFEKCEQEMDDIFPIKKISDLTSFLLSCVDIPQLIEKRKENYYYLKEQLEQRKISTAICLGQEDCPFTLPIFVKERDEFRKYLIENQIYCAVHWPKDRWMSEQRENAVFFSEHLISLPIDQRYEKKEMDYMLSVIDCFGGEILF